MKALKNFGILSLASAIGLMALPGCQRANEKTAEKMMANAISKASGGKAEVDIKNGKFAVKTKDGTSEFSAGGSEWPTDLSSDIPKIEGKIKSVLRASSPQGKHWTISIVGIEAEAVTEYVKALESKGWTIGMNSTTDQGAMAQATKDEDIVVVSYNKSGKFLGLSITVVPPK